MGEKIREKRKLTFDGPLTIHQMETINGTLRGMYLEQNVPGDAEVKIDGRAAMVYVTVKWKDDPGRSPQRG